MGAGALEIGDAVVSSPDDEPVTRIGHVTLVAPAPSPGEAVHVVAPDQDAPRLGGVLQYQVDDPLELRQVPAPSPRLLLKVTAERRCELGLETSHDSAASMRS